LIGADGTLGKKKRPAAKPITSSTMAETI